jgi:hypothetical protein
MNTMDCSAATLMLKASRGPPGERPARVLIQLPPAHQNYDNN